MEWVGKRIADVSLSPNLGRTCWKAGGKVSWEATRLKYVQCPYLAEYSSVFVTLYLFIVYCMFLQSTCLLMWINQIYNSQPDETAPTAKPSTAPTQQNLEPSRRNCPGCFSCTYTYMDSEIRKKTNDTSFLPSNFWMKIWVKQDSFCLILIQMKKDYSYLSFLLTF